MLAFDVKMTEVMSYPYSKRPQIYKDRIKYLIYEYYNIYLKLGGSNSKLIILSMFLYYH